MANAAKSNKMYKIRVGERYVANAGYFTDNVAMARIFKRRGDVTYQFNNKIRSYLSQNNVVVEVYELTKTEEIYLDQW